MSEPAIQVENLSKLYQIGARKTYKTARESVMNTLQIPMHMARKLMGRPPEPDAATDLWALKDVSFTVNRGEVIGIIGRNGAGKSTLLKVLSRITEPTSGRIKIHGRVGSLLEVGTGFHPELTGRENIFLNGAILGMRRAEITSKFDEIVAFSEIEKFIDTPVKHYSSGMYMRLAFAVAAHLEPEILIIDEVLAVGDAAFQKKCLGKMNEVAHQGRTVLFVSHNMSVVQDLCTQGLLLERGRVRESSSLNEAISLYVSEHRSNQARFDKGPLKSLLVRQVGSTLEITADYETDRPVALPCLGLVFSDQLGHPICGTNPRVGGVSTIEPPRNKGTIRGKISAPRLLNGMYRVSAWFGDGRVDWVEHRDCVMLDIVNMAGPRQQPASAVGPVQIDCDWLFDADQRILSLDESQPAVAMQAESGGAA